MAILTRASGALPSVAFNLSLALLFGLTALGAFGIVLNMIASSRDQSERRGLKKSLAPALLGPLFVVVSGNLTGLLEVLYARGVGAVGFWRWLNIRDLDSIPLATVSGLPERFLWWWRASRVIRDVDLHNIPIGLEPIDEFPSFSFLLGDLHPHVLALPFVFVALAIALHLYLDQRNSGEATRGWIVLPALTVLVYGVVLGGLSFLNTWDFPIYVFVVTAAFAAARGARRGWARRVWLDSVAVGIGLTVVGVLLYLPFYISFRSQASGILPNPLYPTRLNQFVVMFGVALIPIVGWLTWVTLRARRLNWRA